MDGIVGEMNYNNDIKTEACLEISGYKDIKTFCLSQIIYGLVCSATVILESIEMCISSINQNIDRLFKYNMVTLDTYNDIKEAVQTIISCIRLKNTDVAEEYMEKAFLLIYNLNTYLLCINDDGEFDRNLLEHGEE